MNKIEKLELEIKRREYAGKATSKRRQLDGAYNEVVGDLREFSKSRILSVCK